MRHRDLAKLERAEDKAWKKMRREFDKVLQADKDAGRINPFLQTLHESHTSLSRRK